MIRAAAVVIAAVTAAAAAFEIQDSNCWIAMIELPPTNWMFHNILFISLLFVFFI